MAELWPRANNSWNYARMSVDRFSNFAILENFRNSFLSNSES